MLARDEVIDAAGVREALGTASEPAGASDLGPDLGEAVRALVDRIAIAEPARLDDGTLYDRVIAEVERALIEAMLSRHAGNQLRTARALGLNRNTLRKRLDSLGLPVRGESMA